MGILIKICPRCQLPSPRQVLAALTLSRPNTLWRHGVLRSSCDIKHITCTSRGRLPDCQDAGRLTCMTSIYVRACTMATLLGLSTPSSQFSQRLQHARCSSQTSFYPGQGHSVICSITISKVFPLRHLPQHHPQQEARPPDNHKGQKAHRT